MWVNSKDYRVLGEVLAKVRKRAGFSQDALADSLKKPQSFVSSYERGQRRIDVLELIRITDALGVDARRVFAEIVASRK